MVWKQVLIHTHICECSPWAKHWEPIPASAPFPGHQRSSLRKLRVSSHHHSGELFVAWWAKAGNWTSFLVFRKGKGMGRVWKDGGEVSRKKTWGKKQLIWVCWNIWYFMVLPKLMMLDHEFPCCTAILGVISYISRLYTVIQFPWIQDKTWPMEAQPWVYSSALPKCWIPYTIFWGCIKRTALLHSTHHIGQRKQRMAVSEN